jgi:hypothetical protein
MNGACLDRRNRFGSEILVHKILPTNRVSIAEKGLGNGGLP